MYKRTGPEASISLDFHTDHEAAFHENRALIVARIASGEFQISPVGALVSL